MERFLSALIIAIVIMPLAFVAAAEEPAGFAPTSVFASKTKITAGETISLFTILYNSSEEKLTGDAVFTVDGRAVDTKHVELGAGDTQTVSISWTAIAGEHAASAHLDNITGASGEKTTLLNASADTITLSVAKAPPPSPAVQAVTSAVSAIQTVSTANAPVVEQTARRAFDSLEYLRQNAVHTLESQLAGQGDRGVSSGDKRVLGASTSSPSKSGAGKTQNASVVSGIWHSFLTALLFVCQTKTLFYLLLAFVVFILFRLLMTFIHEWRHKH